MATMPKRSSLPKQERPENKVLGGGLERMTEKDVLAILLGAGTRQNNVKAVATNLLRRFKERLSTTSPEDLATVPGVGPVKAARLAAAFELAKRCASDTNRHPITSPQYVHLVCQDLVNAKQEVFGYLALDVNRQLVRRVDLYKGTESATLVDPKQVFRTALQEGADSIVLYHNHPAGSLDASEEDKALAARLAKAGKLLNLAVLDFVTFSKAGFSSILGAYTGIDAPGYTAEGIQQLALSDFLFRSVPPPLPHTATASYLFTFTEFFAGIGLLRYALERQGWSVVYANDIDEKKREMYVAHFGTQPDHYHVADIHGIPSDQIPDATLATASFPCTDLSLAGARAGLKGKQSSAFWGFVEKLTEMGVRRPPLVMIENVPGFLTSHKGKDFEDAMLSLNGLGYEVDAFIIDAVRFVPQSRKRLFVIGVAAARLPRSAVQAAYVFTNADIRPPVLLKYVEEHPQILWRLRSLPTLPLEEGRLETILDDLPDDAPQWWSQQRAEYLLSQMSPAHRRQADEMMAGNRWSYGTVFRRIRKGKSMAELRCDGVAGCLRTPKGGSAKQILFKAGHGTYRTRLLTPRECARLMGADDFKIDVKSDQALFGFGDGVCVPVIEWIAVNYLDPVVSELLRAGSLQLARVG